MSIDTKPHYPSLGRRKCHSVAPWNICAPRSNRSSSNMGACNCKPIGKPVELKPHGTEMPPMPARFVLTV
jgi:hypothetical protein